MPAQSALTLNTKVYNPRGRTNDIAQWALVGDTSFGGATSVVTESVRGPSKDGIYRSRWTVNVPKAAEADSTCACIGQAIGTGDVDISFRIPSSFTSSERADFVDRVQALVALAVFQSSVGDLEGSW
jgi:hypothetical protein